MVTHSSILSPAAWWATVHGVERVRYDLSFSLYKHRVSFFPLNISPDCRSSWARLSLRTGGGLDKCLESRAQVINSLLFPLPPPVSSSLPSNSSVARVAKSVMPFTSQCPRKPESCLYIFRVPGTFSRLGRMPQTATDSEECFQERRSGCPGLPTPRGLHLAGRGQRDHGNVGLRNQLLPLG